MSQSKRHSVLEAIANQVVGFALSVATYATVFPLLGIQYTMAMNIGLTLAFTVLSLVRSYTIRRLFNKVLAR